jgi:hypothetical protein
VPKKLIRKIKRLAGWRSGDDRAKPAAAGNFCREAALLSGPTQML